MWGADGMKNDEDLTPLTNQTDNEKGIATRSNQHLVSRER